VISVDFWGAADEAYRLVGVAVVPDDCDGRDKGSRILLGTAVYAVTPSIRSPPLIIKRRRSRTSSAAEVEEEVDSLIAVAAK